MMRPALLHPNRAKENPQHRVPDNRTRMRRTDPASRPSGRSAVGLRPSLDPGPPCLGTRNSAVGDKKTGPPALLTGPAPSGMTCGNTGTAGEGRVSTRPAVDAVGLGGGSAGRGDGEVVELGRLGQVGVYVSAPDDPAMRPDADSEPWFVLANAPRHDPADGADRTAPGLASSYASQVLDVPARRGLDVRDRVRWAEVRTPADPGAQDRQRRRLDLQDVEQRRAGGVPPPGERLPRCPACSWSAARLTPAAGCRWSRSRPEIVAGLICPG